MSGRWQPLALERRRQAHPPVAPLPVVPLPVAPPRAALPREALPRPRAQLSPQSVPPLQRPGIAMPRALGPRQQRLRRPAAGSSCPSAGAIEPTTVPQTSADASAQRNQTRGAFVGSDMCTSSPSTSEPEPTRLPRDLAAIAAVLFPMVGISLASSDARTGKPVSPPKVPCAWERCTIGDKTAPWSGSPSIMT